MSGMMDAVCEQLDDTVLQMFQVLEDIYDQQDKLEQAMKDGFLAMSRARYLLGVKWVSVDQILDADFSSKYRTLTDTSLADEVSTLEAVESSLKTSEIDKLSLFELSQDTTDVRSDQKVEQAEIKKTDADKQTSLRKRHTDNSGPDKNKTKEDIDETNESKKNTTISKNSKKHDDDDEENPPKKESSSNSLSLFGILTPQPLRTSQKHFEGGVSIAVSLADLKLKLSLLQCRYKRLSEQKLSLLSDEQ
ncbi:unnamed protein product [Candidula unifasciata]|uniref:Vacuolar ATPase assembly protein VMA22 n=1 Tax=Candidula unifasciata TaxID=100452 RepID=A0A8S4A4A5_9EUPU|nr:unnamed protein product [Candidula unifasciata]